MTQVSVEEEVEATGQAVSRKRAKRRTSFAWPDVVAMGLRVETRSELAEMWRDRWGSLGGQRGAVEVADLMTRVEDRLEERRGDWAADRARLREVRRGLE